MNHEPNPSTEHRAPSTIYAPNRNYVWTYTLVDELARAGLRDVVIAPGSRSTPLTMAFARHPAIRVWSHIDERGAAFMALGLGLAHDAPAAVVCSSGTAAANFYPAIVEAHYAHVPLLVLTADRPHELRDSGANQTVDQVKLYGDHVLWSVDVALPEANPPDVALRNLRTLADRAYALANGSPKGAVHLNFPFRKPLEPTEVAGEGREIEWGWPPDEESVGAHHDAPLHADALSQDEPPTAANTPPVGATRRVALLAESNDPVRAAYMPPPTNDHPAPHTQIERGALMPTEAQVERMATIMRDHPRGLIVCGPRCPGNEFAAAVNALAMTTGYLLFVDALSGVRYTDDWRMAFGDYEWFIREARAWGDPDLVIHFGAMPTSQVLDDYLSAIEPGRRIAISADGVWTDFHHHVDEVLQVDPVALCHALAARKDIRDTGDQVWWDRFAEAESQVTSDDALFRLMAEGAFFDGVAVALALKDVPDGAHIFVANSLAVRHLDQFGIVGGGDHRVFCSRGASGIDGTISSALGVAAADPDRLTVLIIGDLAFYHDMNALLAAKRNDIRNLVIVLLNNNGGQIFRRLPIHNEAFEPAFTDLFVTPHGMTFEHTAAQFGFDYSQTRERDDFRAAFELALASGKPSIVEVITDAEEDARRRQAIMARVSQALATDEFRQFEFTKLARESGLPEVKMSDLPPREASDETPTGSNERE